MKQFKEQVKISTNEQLIEAKKYYEGVIENIKSVANQFSSSDDEYFKYTTIIKLINQELKERYKCTL